MGPEDPTTPPSNPDLRGLWRVALETRDYSLACKNTLNGWTDRDGVYHEGLITQHNQLAKEVAAIQAQRAQGGERRWVIAAGGIGALLTKVVDMLAQYLQGRPHT